MRFVTLGPLVQVCSPKEVDVCACARFKKGWWSTLRSMCKRPLATPGNNLDIYVALEPIAMRVLEPPKTFVKSFVYIPKSKDGNRKSLFPERIFVARGSIFMLHITFCKKNMDLQVNST